jgi:hypothetical protein
MEFNNIYYGVIEHKEARSLLHSSRGLIDVYQIEDRS